MEMPEDKVRKVLKIAKEPISMETPIGDDEDSSAISSRISRWPSPIDQATMESLRETTHSVLAQLTPREAKVLRMRFGIDMNTRPHARGGRQAVRCHSRAHRQIEAKALRKLRHPSRSEQLRSFLMDDRSARSNAVGAAAACALHGAAALAASQACTRCRERRDQPRLAGAQRVDRHRAGRHRRAGRGTVRLRLAQLLILETQQIELLEQAIQHALRTARRRRAMERDSSKITRPSVATATASADCEIPFTQNVMSASCAGFPAAVAARRSVVVPQQKSCQSQTAICRAEPGSRAARRVRPHRRELRPPRVGWHCARRR